MKLVVGYDRDLAQVHFCRNLTQLIRPPSSPSGISLDEIEYVSGWLAATAVFGNYRRLGTTWIANNPAELEKLAKIPVSRLSQAQTWQAETAANNILTLAGVIERAGSVRRTMDRERFAADRRRIALAVRLYLCAAQSRFAGAGRRQVLVAMSQHTPDWIRYLSCLPGNDYLDLLAGGAAATLVG
jgi:hypothetical protein